MAQISYTNKVALNENPEILDINKVTDDDMNEIKQVVNDNYNNTIQITDTEPTDSDNKIWIDTGEVQSIGSEVHIGTVIDDKIRLNIIKSKNLFDKNNANIISGAYVANNVNVITSSGSGLKLLYIPITGGKTYTISKISSNVFRVTTTTQTPAIGVAIANTTVNNSATSITYTTNSNAKYLVVNYYANADTLTEQEILDSIQIEVGSTATSYENYNSTKINVDGNNIYNEGLSVYSTNEQRIGTWIDGKPLYRKTFTYNDLSQITSGSFGTINTGLSNINVVKLEGVNFANLNNNVITRMIPYNGGGDSINLITVYGGETIRIYYSGTFLTANDNATITIYYTKN